MSMNNSFVCFGCVEIANNAQLAAYHNNACSSGLYTSNCIPNLSWLCWCDDDGLYETFDDPATDNTCWYDPLIPESADYLGMTVTKISGLRASTFTREVSEGIYDGSILHKGVARGKTLVFEALVFGTSAPGLDYGIQWLRSTLEGFNNGICSSNTGGNCFSCNGKSLTIRVHCDNTLLGNAIDTGLHTFNTTGVIDGITVVEDDYPLGRQCCDRVKKVTFTIQTESHYSYSNIPYEVCSTSVCDVDAFNIIDTCPEVIPEICCPFCINSNCDRCSVDPLCDCIIDTGIEPVFIDTTPDCFCEDVCKIIVPCQLTGILGGYDTALKISVVSGSDPFDAYYMKYGLRNVILGVYEDYLGLGIPMDQASYEAFVAAYTPCTKFGATWMPANSELLFDGVQGASWLQCDGNCVDHSKRVFPLEGNRIFPLTAKCKDIIVLAEFSNLTVQESCALPAVPSSIRVEAYTRYNL